MENDGERPTKYFCSLECHNYTEKTIKKIAKYDGSVVVDQKNILSELKNFYSNLFRSFDHQIEDIDLNKLLAGYQVNKLSPEQSTKLDGPLTYQEISLAVKHMKNNKTPGIDGFPAEFFKLFWKNISIWILKALNQSFEKGTFSISLRQCIITCLPKKGKPREFMKNWRPLSMLSVLYKIASASIANRIKPFLDHLISPSQTGFVSGRYIGESTRLVYDIMSFTEENNIPGLIMLIDFEKAFDSISWNFIYKTLTYLGFSRNLIQWIHLFNKDIQARVIQCGVTSELINIGRGCRQGDPISAYLYILVGQIQSILISQCVNIKGITVKGFEFKITQYADDTTLFLDGSFSALQAALNILEIFGSISGLKVNTDKTKLIWIGKKKHCKDKLIIRGLQWGCTEFDLLGLIFSVDLDKMLDLNLSAKITEIKDLIKIWNRRYLTPIGKVTVIKTFFLAKLNHLFLSLPNPNNIWINQLNDILFKFLWSNKPDKINRKTITQEKSQGGLKMMNVDVFINSLKTSWLRRLVKGRDSTPWIKLFQLTINPRLDKISTLGPEYVKSMKQKTNNKFWLNAFHSWYNVLNNQVIKTNNHLLTSPIWYNIKISTEPLFLPNWYSKGILTISDVLDPTGTFMSCEKLQSLYNLGSVNFLSYLRVKLNVLKFIKDHDLQEKDNLARPFIPNHIQIIFKSPKGVSDFYRHLISREGNNHSSKQRWSDDLNTFINEGQWNYIFRTCFKTFQNNGLIWFQMKVL